MASTPFTEMRVGQAIMTNVTSTTPPAHPARVMASPTSPAVARLARYTPSTATMTAPSGRNNFFPNRSAPAVVTGSIRLE